MVPAQGMEPAFSRYARTATVLIRPLLMLLVLVLGALWLRHVPALRHVLDGAAEGRQGFAGCMLFLAGATLWCAFGLPRQVAGFAAGLAYGVLGGLGPIRRASCWGRVSISLVVVSFKTYRITVHFPLLHL